MKLYHGTTEAVARLAFKHGLSPRADTGVETNWECESRSDMVYLSRGYAPYFAAMRTKGDENWGIIEVDTDLMEEPLFHPDEDYLEQVTRTGSGGALCDPNLSMEERIKWYRDNLLDYQTIWEDSVKGLGNCAYLGQIVPSEISRVVIFDPESNMHITMMALDPMISITNWRIMGETKYTALSEWFFGMNLQPGHFDPVFFARLPPGAEGLMAMLESHRKNLEEAIANRSGVEILERKVAT